MLPPETFELPVAELRRGYRSAIYFNRAKRIAALHPEIDAQGVLMQVFQKGHSTLCGLDEAIAILRVATGRWSNEPQAEKLFDEYMNFKLMSRGPDSNRRHLALRNLVQIEEDLDGLWVSEWDDLDVKALADGDRIEPWEPVLHITGRYSSFAHLESVYLGVLARRTLVATNTRNVVDAASGKPVLFFADRFDHWSTQGGDGYAAHIGGATGFASDAMAAWWGEKGMGTMPHALIAFFGGSTLDATTVFADAYPDTNLIALVDFNNDCVTEALDCAHLFGKRLWGVRLDTSENMVDKTIVSLSHQMGDFNPLGVNPRLVELTRQALDAEGYGHVKIIVSGGFNPEKIARFEAQDVPVDVYAVGSSLLRGNRDYTADICEPVAKEGRWRRENTKLVKVD